MAYDNIKSRLQKIIEETLQSVTLEVPDVKITHPHDNLSEDEKLVNEILEENSDEAFHIETTLLPIKPIEYITIKFSYDE